MTGLLRMKRAFWKDKILSSLQPLKKLISPSKKFALSWILAGAPHQWNSFHLSKEPISQYLARSLISHHQSWEKVCQLWSAHRPSQWNQLSFHQMGKLPQPDSSTVQPNSKTTNYNQRKKAQKRTTRCRTPPKSKAHDFDGILLIIMFLVDWSLSIKLDHFIIIW